MPDDDIPTEFGLARFEGTRSPALFRGDTVEVLNGRLSGQIGVVVSVTGHAYNANNKVVVRFDKDAVSWFYPWDLRPVQ